MCFDLSPAAGSPASVEDGILHGGPRQLPGRLPLRRQAPRPVDNHTPDVPIPSGIPLDRNADVDPRARLVGETMYLGRGLVAEYGVMPYAQHRSPQPSFP